MGPLLGAVRRELAIQVNVVVSASDGKIITAYPSPVKN